MTSNRRFVQVLVAALLFGAPALAQEAPSPESVATAESRPPWNERVVELFARLPVQDGGRVKPLDTYAQFRLLRFNGRRKLETPAGERLGPTAWLLDCFFFPELAASYRTFLVRDSALLEAVGVRIEGRKKSDRYSYRELAPARAKLFSEASRISAIEAKDRNGRDAQIHVLAVNLSDFEDLTNQLAFARRRIDVSESRLLREHLGTEPIPAGAFLEKLASLHEKLMVELAALPPGEKAAETAAMEEISHELELVLRAGGATLFPPPSPADEEWHRVDAAFAAGSPESLELLRGWEALETSKGDPAAFEELLADLATVEKNLTARRGEGGKIALEVSFYRGDYFTRALVSFLAAFLCLASSWAAPRSRWLTRGVWAFAGLGTALVVAGVVLRCIIRERPPISTLYETILFVTGTGAIVLFLVEWFNKKGIALSLIPLWGAVGLFLSMKYELKEAATSGDTMPSLVAVLDTNFWLATHVTTITMGYSAGLVAAMLGMRWIIGKVFGHRRDDKDHYRSMTRMTYGVVCFGLIFSVIGTILGGIWANYSWGRFWGWDPKENGALLICLAELMILHLRMGGYIKDFGLAVMACLNGMVVAFSWFGVNLLNVGLHTYGFTSGIAMALYIYYGLSLAVVIAALIWRAVTQRAGVHASQVETAKARG